jgi:RNA ligase (TIGR02306 family)
MSDHTIEVVPVKLEVHSNAESLSIIRVGGWQVIVRTSDWKDGDLGAYIPPDNLVPDLPEYAFLKGHLRIKVKKLRGEWSQGLLVKAPEGSKVGDNVAEQLGILHYEPQIYGSLGTRGKAIKGPAGIYPVYDVEHFNKYKGLLTPGEFITVTEKVHGCNARFVFTEGKMWAGSHREWKEEDSKDLWWRALEAHSEVEEYCTRNPNNTVYCEVYGQVQDLKYGTSVGEVHIAVFDIHRGNWDSSPPIPPRWLDYLPLQGLKSKLPLVPTIWTGPYNEQKVRSLVDGPSLIPGANHIREEIVIRPITERWSNKIGRIQLKLISNNYLERV